MKNIDFSFLKAYFVPILVLITIIALIPLALGPIVNNLKVKNEQYQAKRDELGQLNKKISDLEDIDADQENLKLQEAEKAIPSRKELSLLVIEVGNLAGKNSLIVAGITFTQPGKVATESAETTKARNQDKTAQTSTKKEDEIAFKVTLAGSLENLKGFLVDLEEAKQILGVTSIQSKRQIDGTYRFDLRVVAPFKSVITTGDVVSKPVPPLTADLEAIYKQILKFTSYSGVSLPTVPTGVENPFQ